MNIERPQQSAATPASVLRDLSATHATNAVVGFIFAASGPVAIILAVGTRGGLSEPQLASWVFGAFVVNGLVSIAFSLVYRQPLTFFWTIPGTVLVGPALTHLPFAEIVGAFLATGVLMLALGLSGLVRRCMDAVPMPIVMGMVAGVFLQFGLAWIGAFGEDLPIAASMTATHLALTAVPSLARRVPPLIAALVVGLAVAGASGSYAPDLAAGAVLAAPLLQVPRFSAQAMVELVVPLAITVLLVQNGQGIAVLTASGHRPPANAIAASCGAASIVAALVGTVSTCLTGPVNAIISANGSRETQYAAGVLVGILAVAFGLFAPLFTRLMLAAPHAFIATLAGLAMLKVLQTAFATAFGGPRALGALVAFLVTVSGIAVLNIGAPFWGLVFGYAVSRLLERETA
ncbi:MAG: benzoate/H(+) symporter BenE family transporter [Alphaproteobacteria bacterium]|nr:benzoate/H(+) symporter BenE family transporter [Alphaproteobacteria bacterium]